jgi:hypothetical protein
MWYSKGVEGLWPQFFILFIMTQFKITYGVGGGYNDISTEIIEANTLDEANEIAYVNAIEVFESYGVYEENDMTDEYDESEYQESIERWIDYSVEPI